ncbi:sn-glycerol-3-phosphate ABC transporter ATP-binding protein UgpC [Aquamicrobium lusatiense]|uniref:ABC transporter ATP-binding protein n=1 Tax=Aquamicrobium lusatiense TaxID=89772 RepID=UPI00245856F3|nr:sn-glycerol-3-phosphate ABC transporter ATP-binding protein UgpC [Aquamicrobium lusatiense]MDH4992241.1 sn-glycerol-3-phosphate ABC transporter ATP-binding protein UgpC [Aquamicrobium lusatiense]
MAPVTIDNIRKSYGNLDVMHGVSVDIEDGEFMVLVGPSGSGKSTLLRMIAGLESITDGSIRIGSRIINDVAPKDRDIAMVFQNYALYPHMTVRENMAFALRLRKMAAQEIDKRIEQAAGILGLSALLDRYPRQLSGGQRQRVAMGRATVRDPQVFLFDEPLSNLDAKLRVTMRSEIKSLHQRLRTTTVYVTHDQVEAMTMADRIVVMHNGVVEQIGTPLDLYDRPGNLFVAGFIGSPSMNFIEGTVRLGQRATFSGPEGFAMDLDEAHGLEDGQHVVLGIRPEHLMIASEGIPAEVAVVEPTGSETLVMAQCGTQNVTCVLRERLSVKPEDTIYLNANTDALHLFDPQSGERLLS